MSLQNKLSACKPTMSSCNTPDAVFDKLNDELHLLAAEQRIERAIVALKLAAERGAKYSINQAAKDYKVPRSTLQGRYHGVPTRSEAHAHQQKLTPAQEVVLVEWIKVQVSSN